MNENTLAVLSVICVSLGMFALAYAHTVQSTIVVRPHTYDNVGVMEYKTENDTLYIPVYRRQ